MNRRTTLVFLALAAAATHCSASEDDAAGGTGNGGATPGDGTPNASSSGAAAGASSGAASSSSSSGGPTTALGEGESTTFTTFASTGLVPFDVDRSDLVGPAAHDAQYGSVPHLVAVPGPDYVDVAVESTTDQRVSIVRLRQIGEEWGITRVIATPRTLGRLMGMTRGAGDVFFYATGTADPDITTESPAPNTYRSDIVRLFELGPTGTVARDIDLDIERGKQPKAEPIVRPMVASSARLAFTEGQLSLVHGINTKPDDKGTRHQKALTTGIDASTGAITRIAGAWVSHSFDQRTLVDGASILEAHLGDAYPRGVELTRMTGAGLIRNTVYRIKGETGDNNTFSRLGSVVRIEGGDPGRYLVAFATERETAAAAGKIQGTRELSLVRVTSTPIALGTDESFGTVQAVTSGGKASDNHVLFLTNHAAASPRMHVERPRLVACAGDEFLALYELWTDTQFQGAYAQRIDANGTVLAAEQKIGTGHLPRGDDAFAFGGGAAWITGNSEAHTLTLHQLAKDLTTRESIMR